MTRVLPEPGPARIRRGPSVCSTASRWRGVRASPLGEHLAGRNCYIGAGPAKKIDRRPQGQAHHVAVAALVAFHRPQRFVLDSIGAGLVEGGATGDGSGDVLLPAR